MISSDYFQNIKENRIHSEFIRAQEYKITGPLHTRSQGQKILGPTLSIFGLQIWPQVTNKC
jgi:hypothetical protein